MPDNMGKNGEGYPKRRESAGDGESSGDQQPYSAYETDCGAGRI